MIERRVMSGRRIVRSVQALLAHGLLFVFTILLVSKLDRAVSYSWWLIFVPLWLFHLVVARGRFSVPAPLIPYDRHWAPCHAIVATPLLVSFELLLCVYLESMYAYGFAAVNLKIVFLPLLALELIIFIDNFRMCRALLPGDDESMNDEAIRETLPHFWITISMVFFVAATIFMLLKLSGDIGSLGWWDLFINFGIAECFAFLVCTKWSNPMIHRNCCSNEATSSSMSIRSLSGRSLDMITSSMFSSEEDEDRESMCTLQDIGGHVMKIPLVCFQVMLCMYLEGTPPTFRHLPLPVLFSPIFLLQVLGTFYAFLRLVEKITFFLRNETGSERYLAISSRAHDCFGFLYHGSRLLGWWSIDEGSREEQAQIYHSGVDGYNTFVGYPPEIVKKMPKKDLTEEVWRLQTALGQQSEVTKFRQQEFEKLQNEKVLCRICFLSEISIVLLPCRHRVLCSTCADKCKKCPICRVSIEERMLVYDV